MRLSADYAERVAIPQEEAQNILQQAETFVLRVKTYLCRVLDDASLADNPGGMHHNHQILSVICRFASRRQRLDQSFLTDRSDRPPHRRTSV
jgi:hypothetical protein